jgi:hypothetical protein
MPHNNSDWDKERSRILDEALTPLFPACTSSLIHDYLGQRRYYKSKSRGPEEMGTIFFIGSLFSLEPITITICGLVCALAYYPRLKGWYRAKKFNGRV